jgi:hypothetical protein
MAIEIDSASPTSPPPEHSSSPQVGERFALAALADGFVLLDLQGGAFYRVNAIAARICQGLIAGHNAATMALELTKTYGVSQNDALRDVEAMRAQVERSPEVKKDTNPITFVVQESGYVMQWRQRPVCAIDVMRQKFTLLPAAQDHALDLEILLLWAAPHLLLLQGQGVLHASAIQRTEGILALSGTSGAGKTTTAQAFARQGAALLAEDLILVDMEGTPQAIRGGEAAVRAWAAAQAPALASQGWIGVEGLREASAGPRVPLRTLAFLSPRRSTGERLEREPLGQTEALLLLLENGFAELGTRPIWLDLLRRSVRIVQTVPTERWRCPEGLERLQQAVRRYS